jgi:hypothetical protein
VIGSPLNANRAPELCLSCAATRVNDLKAQEKRNLENTGVCSYFASSGKLWETIVPPLHGGGQGFESPRLHFISRSTSEVSAPNQIVNESTITRFMGSVGVR